ncbi:MAG TPA: electron transfer flavoprotein subunit alpha/FixB family protein [Ignavibacteriales bacterium]|nr:electron transfer flavoprotein subunit alpha/FixB family protein [Ignavibacteriales bacterium]HPD68500.1 electron transfer flavoprotein subunit alpha/FixB family protein [Ignavibacteriales bacterium]HPP32855.1 electron transfer flavoprotein subunit alpha/FixB family protein [Ignavibacteriales bacterium]HRT98204.1 electron transfer flavoprotein subunit alpha/FixB family protein [Ignavibacteriales bacterium]
MENISKDVFVFVEQNRGIPADVSFELLTKGRKLADKLGGELKAIVLGYNVEDIAKETFTYGSDECFLVDHPELKYFRTLPYSNALGDLILTYQPRIVLFGATIIGRDIAPRLASKTKSGLTADCTDLQISDVVYLKQDYKDLLLQIRPAFGGNIIATIITPDTKIQMATVREGVMQKIPVSNPKTHKITKIEYKPSEVDNLVEVIEQHIEEKKVNLKAAPIIVAGGYGMGSKENFRLIHELAKTIGGEVAGSRAAVDAGFITPDRQVGQTGVTVRPKLYIACGISGAIQHRAGMQESNKIIAINNDPDAPIFSIAHYGIVGDVTEVIPMFIEAYKNKLK